MAIQAPTSAAVRQVDCAICCEGLHITYDSPSVGEVEFGWTGPLTVAGELVALHDYPRFDNLYCQNAFTAPQIHIQRGDKSLTLDFRTENL